jgi:hypothetical protein
LVSGRFIDDNIRECATHRKGPRINDQIANPTGLPSFNDLNWIELIAISGCGVVGYMDPVATLKLGQCRSVFGGIRAKPDVLAADRGGDWIVPLCEKRRPGEDKESSRMDRDHDAHNSLPIDRGRDAA